MKRFNSVLKLKGLKATHQRLVILDIIEEMGHADVDTIYDKVYENFPTMSKATVYRNINDLTSNSILQEINLPGKKHQYEIKKTPHVHLLCKKCGEIEDAFVHTEELLTDISKESGFKIINSFIAVDGICKKCQ